MSAILKHEGVIVREQEVIDLIGREAYAKMKKQFVKTVKLPHNKFKSHRLVIECNNTKPNGTKEKVLIVKRFLGFKWLECKYLNSITNKITCDDYTPIGSWNIALPLYPIQQTLHDELLKTYLTPERAAAGNAGTILELEAGMGKTFVAAHVAASLKKRTLYVVLNEFLMDQAIADFEKVLPGVAIGKYYSRKKSWGDIMFIIVNSINSKEFVIDKITYTPTAFFAQFGLTIWDEIHEYCTPRGADAFARASTPYMLGITAEANGRTDKMDFIAHMSCGAPFYSDRFEPYTNLMDVRDETWTSKCQIIKYIGPPSHTQTLKCETTQMMMMSRMVRQIIQDPYRFQLLLNYAIDFYKAGKNFFIWTDMQQVVRILTEALAAYGILAEAPEIGSNTAPLMGGGTRIEAAGRVQAAQNARVIVATYQYACRGVSLPQFDAMIFATPRRAKMYQTLKRIFRLGSDVSITREVIDIVDEGTKLKAQLTDRRREYNKKEIFNMTIEVSKCYHIEITLDPNIVQILNNAVQTHMQPEHIIDSIELN